MSAPLTELGSTVPATSGSIRDQQHPAAAVRVADSWMSVVASMLVT